MCIDVHTLFIVCLNQSMYCVCVMSTRLLRYLTFLHLPLCMEFGCFNAEIAAMLWQPMATRKQFLFIFSTETKNSSRVPKAK